MLPLDDLLPTNDAVYEPPADLRDLFTLGSPIFELADVHKYNREGMVSPADFRDGWHAGIFEICLKSGIKFHLSVNARNVDRLVQRAKQFGRTVETRQWDGLPETWSIIVSEHASE